MTVLENKAKNGDWELKEEFAATYLYETYYPFIYGCEKNYKIKHGHRCRAMAKRTDAGKAFLKEIIDAQPNESLYKGSIASFQYYYAEGIRHDKYHFEEGNWACRETIRYYELLTRPNNIVHLC